MALADNPLVRLTGRQQHLWNKFESLFPTENDLAAAAVALGADRLKPWSDQETALVRAALREASSPTKAALAMLRDLIRGGFDPLGEAFCTLRSTELRRENGATYTPGPIVRSMIEWAVARKQPARVVDPGSGSGRFLMQAAAAFPAATLIGVDTDPLAALLARANLATMGHAARAQIVLGDYRRFNEPGPSTLYIGNPPYVRHHQISSKWKDWLSDQAAALGYKASQLAGLHVHFFLATARYASPGDFGAFITAAEWLDVNYGALVRSLVVGELGGHSITVIEPTAQPFPDAATTAAITTFEIASKPTSVFFRRVDNLRELDDLNKGRRVHRDRLTAQARWSYLTRSVEKPPQGYVELGELCRVHRGQVTGANEVWIAGEHSEGLPASVLFPTVTRAREVFEAAGVLDDASRLKCVIDLPVELDQLGTADRRVIDKFLRFAQAKGANMGYIASHRKAWWSVGLREPAPIISTYMARRPPAFVVNRADARHINIAHGLYPRDTMSATAQTTLVRFLRANISQRDGRTYAGGLTKFEPREMERLVVPGPSMLASGVVSD
jgi:hypothetical protein